MDGQKWLLEMTSHYRQYKRKCERAAEQVSDEDLFAAFSDSQSSISLARFANKCLLVEFESGGIKYTIANLCSIKKLLRR